MKTVIGYDENPHYSPVTASVEILAGGQPQDAINKIGWPGEINLYRVDFTVPNGTSFGTLPLRLQVSGIAGPTVTIPVQ